MYESAQKRNSREGKMGIAAKHAPATPLPWFAEKLHHCEECKRNNENYHHAILRAGGGKIARIEWFDGDDKDAAYLVHAANAYPKLVEQLQALADSHAKLEEERGSQRATHTANARALLRSLGEDA